MPTTATHSSYSNGSAPTTKERECLCCEIQPFCRNNFFTGKLLTERDLTAEQRYFMDKLRLHHVRLHGWGVVCGLKVKPHDWCPAQRIVVEPGMAIDGCGREILVWKKTELKLPIPAVARVAPQDPCPPEGEAPGQPTEYPSEEGMRHPCPPPIDLYVCLRYRECETEFMPAPFDECACQGNPQRPNRVCEGYHLEVTADPPEDLQCHPDGSHCRHGDCEDLYKTILEPCTDPGRPKCLILAVIHGFVPSQVVEPKMIDNLKHRRFLPSTQLLDDLIHCILEKLPAQDLTRIEDINWTHAKEYPWSDFERKFLGDEASKKGFEVTFSDEVHIEAAHSGALPPHLFEATALRRHESHQGGYFEVVPAHAWISSNKTRFHLRLDPQYLRHCLVGKPFDLFLRVRCDLVVGRKGRPVDGNLLARLKSNGAYEVAPPTGDGIPGGMFESWIQVLG